MERKSNAGRKPLPKNEKVVAVTIWVKSKHKAKAKAACNKIQSEFNKL